MLEPVESRIRLTVGALPASAILFWLFPRLLVYLLIVVFVWIAAIPAGLVAFLQSPQQALYVALLYLVLQSIDAYLFVEDVIGDHVMSGGGEPEGENRGGKRTGDEGRV